MWNSDDSLVCESTINCEAFHDYWLNLYNYLQPHKHYFNANKGSFSFSDSVYYQKSLK